MNEKSLAYMLYTNLRKYNNRNAEKILNMSKIKLPICQVLNTDLNKENQLTKFANFFKLPFNEILFEFFINYLDYNSHRSVVAILEFADINFVKSTMDKVMATVNNPDHIKIALNAITNLKDNYVGLQVYFEHEETEISAPALFLFSIDANVLDKNSKGPYITMHGDDILIHYNGMILGNMDDKKIFDHMFNITNTLRFAIYSHIFKHLLWINCKRNRIHTYITNKKHFKLRDRDNQQLINKFRYGIIDIYNQVNISNKRISDAEMNRCIDIDPRFQSVRGHFKCIKGNLHWWSPHFRNKQYKDDNKLTKDYHAH